MKLFCRKCNHKFSSASPKCPKCNSLRNVYPVATVHYLVADDDGPVKSAYSSTRVLCGDLTSPSAINNIHWTAEQSCVTCDECLALIKSSLPETEAKLLTEEELQWHLEHGATANH